MKHVTKIDGQGRRVLVVDDDLSIRVLLDAVLKRMEFDVMLASDGRRALELTGRYDFDLILLDLLMPIMDGYEVLEHIEAKSPPHIIVFTGSEERTRQIPRDKICEAILKPFDLEHFTSTVARCLEAQHTSDESSSVSAESET